MLRAGQNNYKLSTGPSDVGKEEWVIPSEGEREKREGLGSFFIFILKFLVNFRGRER